MTVSIGGRSGNNINSDNNLNPLKKFNTVTPRSNTFARASPLNHQIKSNSTMTKRPTIGHNMFYSPPLSLQMLYEKLLIETSEKEKIKIQVNELEKRIQALENKM